MIADWAAARGITPAVAFLAYVAKFPGVRVLVGCESLAQFEQNLGAWVQALDWTQLISPLADSIPSLPEEILNPARWPHPS